MYTNHAQFKGLQQYQYCPTCIDMGNSSEETREIVARSGYLGKHVWCLGSDTSDNPKHEKDEMMIVYLNHQVTVIFFKFWKASIGMGPPP